MSNKVQVVSALLTEMQRGKLLTNFTPYYPNVYGFGLTWAYRVTPEFQFPRHSLELILDGYYRGEKADAATGYLYDPTVRTTDLIGDGGIHRERVRPDGKLVHVTLSVMDGVSPVEGGNIKLKEIQELPEPLRLKVNLIRRHASQFQPERRENA